MSELTVEKKMFPPQVGMMSLVGIHGKDYPLLFGNYCSISDDGPYLCNFWAENLKEWARRNPDVEEIEVTVVKHGERCIGFVSDERMKDWCNDRLCITGHGWPSVAVCRKVCDFLLFDPTDRFCGCETGTQGPHLIESYHDGRPSTLTCRHCKREWSAKDD